MRGIQKMDKLLEALKKTSLNEAQVNDVVKAVDSMVSEAIKQIETKKQAEYDAKLEEAYDKVQAEIDATEGKALEGYKQAHAIIQDQQLRIETLEREYENKMEEGYQQAWEMLQAEQSKNENIELNVQREADEKLKSMRDFMVEKLDLFLQMQKAEVYEEARRDVLNDPKMVEHRVAIEKMADIMSDYLSVEELSGTSSKRLAEAANYIEDLEGRLKILEKKNINTSKQLHSVNETLRQNEQLVNEARTLLTESEKKERKNSSGTVSGRGQRVINENKEELIPEFSNTNNKKSDKSIKEHQLVEDMLVLSGLQESK